MGNAQKPSAPRQLGAMSGGTSKRLMDLHPEGARALARLGAAAWEVADSLAPRSCAALRIAQLLGNELASDAGLPAIEARKLENLGAWDTSSLYSPAERAHLEFTEQFVTSVSDVTSEHVDALLECGSAEDVRSFVAALYVVELSAAGGHGCPRRAR